MRRRYLTCYDIREPKRLRRVHKLMKSYGYALQYSVFICDLTGMEYARLKAGAASIMHLGVDSLVAVDLGATDLGRFEFIGTPALEPPDSGPVIA